MTNSNSRYLNLSYNLLQDISRSGFYGLDTLETLDLSFNDLRSVDASIFDNQKWLVDLKVYPEVPTQLYEYVPSTYLIFPEKTEYLSNI